MKERPILFSAPMVQAILEGRKTMTRRVVRIPKMKDSSIQDEFSGRFIDGINKGFGKCPYGKPGDRLWVRETFTESSSGVIYRADPMFDHCKKGDISWKWKPSIFMRRKFSRITLEITNVRIERLWDINTADVFAEGMEMKPEDDDGSTWGAFGSAEQRFKELWEPIYIIWVKG